MNGNQNRCEINGNCDKPAVARVKYKMPKFKNPAYYNCREHFESLTEEQIKNKIISYEIL